MYGIFSSVCLNNFSNLMVNGNDIYVMKYYEIRGKGWSKIEYSCIIGAQIITISNNDITITNKICMGFARGHT